MFFASRKWFLCVPVVPREDSCRRNRGIGMTFINKMWDRDISEMEYIKRHFANRAECFLCSRDQIVEAGQSFEGGLDIKDGDDIWVLRLRLRKKKKRK